jgi:hypothetical protein
MAVAHVQVLPPVQIIEYNTLREIQWPYGKINVTGADNGLIYPLYLNKTAQQQMFDPTLFRAVDISYAGAAV